MEDGFDDLLHVIPPPLIPYDRREWRELLARWREDARTRVDHDPSLYERPELAWMSRAFVYGFLMVWDERLYDASRDEFRVEEFVAEETRRFGGYDAVCLWHAYPRLGFDDRNQFDLLRSLPGGLAGVQDLIQRFQALGIRVFLAFNPWDTGTRREPTSDAASIVEIVSEVAADGVYLDTLGEDSAGLQAMQRDARRSLVLETELPVPLRRVGDHLASWAQWYDDTRTPAVLRNKWFEQRHMMHVTRRFDERHTAELQMAWMNGAGVVLWENVFGLRMEWCDRDAAALRMVVAVQRRFAEHFTHGKWRPLIEIESDHVYASSWELQGATLHTLVNRSRHDQTIRVSAELGDQVAIDLLRGITLRSDPEGFEVTVEGEGFGAAYTCEATKAAELEAFLVDRRAAYEPLARFEPRPATGQQHRRKPPIARRRDDEVDPNSMLSIGPVTRTLVSTYRDREYGTYGPPDHLMNVAYPATLNRRLLTFDRKLTVERFAIDIQPVTEEAFATFLAEIGRPSRVPPLGDEHAPAVSVTLDEAREFAAWRKARLPTEEEWQVAAETGMLIYGTPRVWNLTETELTDGRTRSVILKGGSDHPSTGSDWYADTGPQEPSFSSRFILISPAIDRCVTIGFRCAVDLH